MALSGSDLGNPAEILLREAQLEISTGYEPADGEQLSVNYPGFTYEWNAEKGQVVVLPSDGGFVSLEEMQAVLKTVTFYNPSQDPNDDIDRQITLVLVEELARTPPRLFCTVHIEPRPDWPVPTVESRPLKVVEKGGFSPISPGVRVTDRDSEMLRSARFWIEPLLPGDVITYARVISEDRGRLSVSKGVQGGKPVWVVSGMAPLEVYEKLLSTFALKNDGPSLGSGPDLNRTAFFAVYDELGLRGETNRSVVMVPVNDLPVITGPKTIRVEEEKPQGGVITAYDPEGEEMTYSLACPPGHGTATVNPETGEFVYTGDPDYHGIDSIVVSVTDESGGVTMGEITIKVIQVPDRPVADTIFIEVWMGQNTTIAIPGYDPDGDEVKIYIVMEPVISGAPALGLSQEEPAQEGSTKRKGDNPAWFVGEVQERILEYSDYFQFVAVDEETKEISDVGTVYIRVRNPLVLVNDPPVVEDVSVSTIQDEPVSINLQVCREPLLLFASESLFAIIV